jgi:hypothetical protein
LEVGGELSQLKSLDWEAVNFGSIFLGETRTKAQRELISRCDSFNV